MQEGTIFRSPTSISMIASAIIFTMMLLASRSTQAPVKSKQSANASSSNTHSASTSLYNLVKNRPLCDKIYALEQYHKDFAAHPDVKRINLDGNKLNIAAQFQSLRGDVVDGSWNTKLTRTVNDYLKRSNAKQEVLDSVNALNYVRRRGVARIRERFKEEAMSEEDVIKRKRHKEELRYKRDARMKETHAQGLRKTHISDESYKVSLDKRLGNRHLNAFDIAKESEDLRHTHFKTSQAHYNALEAYMLDKKISLPDISLAIARQKQLKEKGYPVQSRIKKTTTITPSEAGTSKIHSSPDSSSSTVPSSKSGSTDQAFPSATGDKSTIDKLDETPWWDHAGY